MTSKGSSDDREVEAISNTGNAISLVERVVSLAESSNQPGHNVEAVARDDLVFFAERLFRLQKQYIGKGIPGDVDVGYHYTDSAHLPDIRTHGLLTKGDRKRKSLGGTVHGCRFGDGVYTANNAVAFSAYGNMGLIVGRLQGKTHRVSRSLAVGTEVDANTIVGDRIKSDAQLDSNGWPLSNKYNEVVLRTSAQCVPLIKYDTTLTKSKEGLKCIVRLENGLKSILGELFDTRQQSSPFRRHASPKSAPAIRHASSVDTEAAVAENSPIPYRASKSASRSASAFKFASSVDTRKVVPATTKGVATSPRPTPASSGFSFGVAATAPPPARAPDRGAGNSEVKRAPVPSGPAPASSSKSSTAGLFGSKPASATSGRFEASPAPAPGGLFGQPAPAKPAPSSGGLFGQQCPAPAAGGFFGQAPAPASGSVFVFGSDMLSSQPAPAPAAVGLFGQAQAPSDACAGSTGGKRVSASSRPAGDSLGEAPVPSAGALFGSISPLGKGASASLRPAAASVSAPNAPVSTQASSSVAHQESSGASTSLVAAVNNMIAPSTDGDQSEKRGLEPSGAYLASAVTQAKSPGATASHGKPASVAALPAPRRVETKATPALLAAAKAPVSEAESSIDYKKLLANFFEANHPARSEEVDATLLQYEGNEEQLFIALAKEYNKPNALNVVFESRVKEIHDSYHTSLAALYLQVFTNGTEAEQIMAAFKGRETDLFARYSAEWKTCHPLMRGLASSVSHIKLDSHSHSANQPALESRPMPTAFYPPMPEVAPTPISVLSAANHTTTQVSEGPRSMPIAFYPPMSKVAPTSFNEQAASESFSALANSGASETVAAAPEKKLPTAPVYTVARKKSSWIMPESTENGFSFGQKSPSSTGNRKRSGPDEEDAFQASSKKRKCLPFGCSRSPNWSADTNVGLTNSVQQPIIDSAAVTPSFFTNNNDAAFPAGNLHAGSTAWQQAGAAVYTGSSFATNQSTAFVPFHPTVKQDGTDTLVLHSITAMPDFERESFEELRLGDYIQGNKGTQFGGNGAHSQPNATFAQPGPPPFPSFRSSPAGQSGSTFSLAPKSEGFGFPPWQPLSSTKPEPQTVQQLKLSIVPQTLTYVAPSALASVPPHTLVAPPSSCNMKEDCVICHDMLSNHSCVALARCQHVFHDDCIHQALKAKLQCPVCRLQYGVPQGTSPSGSMKVFEQLHTTCSGYSEDTIVIHYDMPSNTQKEYHPNPGQHHSAKVVRAYLPNTLDGQDLLRRLKYAFVHGLTFSVGTSATSGRDNVITWASVHHKTSTHGGVQRHGYPDVEYFNNCNGELDGLRVPPASCLEDDGEEINAD